MTVWAFDCREAPSESEIRGPEANFLRAKRSQATQMNTSSVLRQPLFTSDDSLLTLPAMLSALGLRQPINLRALRPHQNHAWYAFLVQLGALVTVCHGDRSLHFTEAEWRDALLALAGPAGEPAWTLVVADLSRPAFLQPPIPEGDLARFRSTFATPDALDVLVTAKNHDEKQDRIAAPRPEHWAYAIVTLQTMEGYLGRGNYGIARMNGGFSSRPAVGLSPGFDWGERFRRDIAVWLDERPTLTSPDFGYRADGPALLWLLPWSGAKEESLSLSSLDPFFIEICRRVRLVSTNGGVLALAANTDAPRVDARLATGRTGDVWTPVNVEGKALTVGPGGFDYRLLTDLLLGGDYPAAARPASRPRPEDGPFAWLMAEVLTRGQGKTEGYHRRAVPIPAFVRGRLERPTERASLAELARRRIDQAAVAERRVLHPALCALLQGGKDRLDIADKRTRPWIEHMDQQIDDVFFESLWTDAADDIDPEDASCRWAERLVRLTRGELARAFESAAAPLATRARGEARAQLMLNALARRHLPAAFNREPEEETAS